MQKFKDVLDSILPNKTLHLSLFVLFFFPFDNWIFRKFSRFYFFVIAFILLQIYVNALNATAYKHMFSAAVAIIVLCVIHNDDDDDDSVDFVVMVPFLVQSTESNCLFFQEELLTTLLLLFLFFG